MCNATRVDGIKFYADLPVSSDSDNVVSLISTGQLLEFNPINQRNAVFR